MSRAVLGLIALTALTAFAPAPFPRTGRRDSGPTTISQEQLQGRWKVISFDIYQQGGQKQRSSLGVPTIRVQGDRWTMLNQGDTENAKYDLVIDGSKRPATIDFWSTGRALVKEGKPSMFGLIRRSGDTVEVLYNWGHAGNRPASFDNPPAGWWLLILERTR